MSSNSLTLINGISLGIWMPYANLETRIWSPISRVLSMDPEGILKACKRKVRMNRARSRAMKMASAYSLKTLFWRTCCLALEIELIPLFSICPQNSQKRILRDFDFSYLLHLFFTGFLFFQELSFSGNVSAIAFGENIFS